MAVNFEEVDMDSNDDNSLCRFEFFEILLRLAKGKFMDFGEMTSLYDSTKRLLKEHILPLKSTLAPWQSFRD